MGKSIKRVKARKKRGGVDESKIIKKEKKEKSEKTKKKAEARKKSMGIINTTMGLSSKGTSIKGIKSPKTTGSQRGG